MATIGTTTETADYLRLLEIRGERSVPRLTYVEGTLEIMSPSLTHEEIKSYIGRLVEAWCLERGVDFTPYPNVKRWLDRMTALPNWPKVNEAFYGLRDAVKSQKFVTLG